ncbi:serine/arginine repetitive matrix protein 1-like [Oppia nitens]|uniref:serine/arginine repetitive matrix protein 1-like n=1 Tax=Oppia nitens TaxID=1686743 RepID=UPI0023D9CAD5|nr:serine/arginine repetitive matrix protein 1-like [Oppia nitens]
MDPRKPMYRLPDFRRRLTSGRQPTPFAPMRPIVIRPILPKGAAYYYRPLGGVRPQSSRLPTPTLRRTQSLPTGLSRMGSDEPLNSRLPSPPGSPIRRYISTPIKPEPRRSLRPLTFMEPRVDYDSESTSDDENDNRSLIGRPVSPKQEWGSNNNWSPTPPQSPRRSPPTLPANRQGPSWPPEPGSRRSLRPLTFMEPRVDYDSESTSEEEDNNNRKPLPPNSFKFSSSSGSNSGRSLYPSSSPSSLSSGPSFSGLFPPTPPRTPPTTTRSRSRFSPNTSIQRIEPIPDMTSFDRINQFESSDRRSYPMSDALPRDRGYYAGREFESTESRRSPFSRSSADASGQSSGSSRAGGFRNTFRRIGSAIRTPFRRRRRTYDINSDSQQQQQQQHERMSYLNEEEEEGSPKGNVPLCGCGHTYNDCKCRLI